MTYMNSSTIKKAIETFCENAPYNSSPDSVSVELLYNQLPLFRSLISKIHILLNFQYLILIRQKSQRVT